MLPVVVRLTHPAWGRALPVALAFLAVALGVVAFLKWRSGARRAFVMALAAALLSATVALATWQQAVTPRASVVHAFGVALCVGVLLAWPISRSWSKRLALGDAQLPAALVASAIGALLGARLWYLAAAGLAELRWHQLLALHDGGLASWGALIGGVLALRVWCMRAAEPFSPWACALTPAAATALVLGRIGAFFSGSQHGQVLTEDAPGWLRSLGRYERWPDDVMAISAGPPVWVAQVEHGAIDVSSALSHPVHPVQLYEAAALLLVLAVLLARPERWCRWGVPWLLFAYCALSFTVQWLRADGERGLLGPALGVWVGPFLGVVLFGALLLQLLRGQGVRVRRAVQWGVGFMLIHGVVAWGIASELRAIGQTQLRLSLAQWTAVVVALAACTFFPRRWPLRETAPGAAATQRV